MPRDVGVVIVAAGRGERLGGVPKQYRELAGIPMLVLAIRPFASHPAVRHVVVVLARDEAKAPPVWLAALTGGSLSIVPGGAERGDSVAAGLAALPSECSVVLVHDAARPFVERPVIDGIVAQARAGTSAIAAVPMSDTVKESTPDGTIARTLPREALWRAQTPQGFPRPVLAAAYAQAQRDGIAGTDDAALVERTGATVRLVPDSVRNFKVTTAEDLVLAELWALHTR